MRGKRVILTGMPGSGKSTLCNEIIQHARERKVDLKGVLSPPVFAAGKKIGIAMVNLATGESARLASLRQVGRESVELTTRRWAFEPKVMEIGSQILGNSTPCELLVVDELGPLEFVRGEGWQSGLAAVDSGVYQSALVVVRPGLLETALKRWPDAQKVEILTTEQVSALKKEMLGLLGLPA